VLVFLDALGLQPARSAGELLAFAKRRHGEILIPGAELGIDLHGREQRDYCAVDGNVMRGWVVPLQLEINGIAHPVHIEVAFVEENEIPLLGQTGFFDSFEVRFRGFHGLFEIIPVLDPGTDKYLM